LDRASRARRGAGRASSGIRPRIETSAVSCLTGSGASGYERQLCRARDPGDRLFAGRGVTTAPHEDGEDEMCSVRQREDPRVVRAGPDGPGLVEDVRALREARPQPAVARSAPAHRVEDAVGGGAREKLAAEEPGEERRDRVWARAVLNALLERGEVLLHRLAHALLVEGDAYSGDAARRASRASTRRRGVRPCAGPTAGSRPPRRGGGSLSRRRPGPRSRRAP